MPIGVTGKMIRGAAGQVGISVIFEDDFNTDLSKWDLEVGSPQITGGTLDLTTGDSVIKDVGGSQVYITVDFITDALGNGVLGVYARSKYATGEYWLLVLNANANTISLISFSTENGQVTRGTEPVPLAASTSYPVIFSLMGENIYAVVNGVTVSVDVLVPPPEYHQDLTEVRLAGFSSADGRFDNLVVYNGDPTL
jgi:hypothetical protein